LRGLADQEVDVFRHHDVSDDYETVALPRLFQDGEETVAVSRGTEKRQSPVTRTSDKVQVMGAVSAMQTARHDKANSTGSIGFRFKSFRTAACAYSNGQQVKEWRTAITESYEDLCC